MKIQRHLAVLAMAAAPLLAFAAGSPPAFSNGVLVDDRGRTLYTFDKDEANSGKSACTGECASAWPPALASADDKPRGDFGIITRDDGARQWSYKGRPVYTFQRDKNPGDRTGDNFKDVWHVVPE